MKRLTNFQLEFICNYRKITYCRIIYFHRPKFSWIV